MNQKNLGLFIAISIAILFISQWLLPPPRHPLVPVTATTASSPSAPLTPPIPGGERLKIPPANVPRVAIEAPRVEGSISLLGASLDDLRLRDYRETTSKQSPLVEVLAAPSAPEPSYMQFGWSAEDGTATPTPDTLWTSAGGTLTQDHPVTLSWDNGAGVTYRLTFTVDANYVFGVTQSVHNGTGKPVKLWPWQRIRRDYAPKTSGYSVIFEGALGIMDNRLQNITYSTLKSDAAKATGGAPNTAYQHDGTGGWAGFTDKYWLLALVPDQTLDTNSVWNHWMDGAADRYEVSYTSSTPEIVAPGTDATLTSRAFAGAKEVHLLDRYESNDNIPLLSYAVDWGMWFFITKPFFYMLDWLNGVLGNFGIAILVFTLFVKALFYPIASRSYESMGKMRLLGPKIAAAKERYKDDPAKQQAEMMALYKAEKVNPASGCLPMLLQIPVFFALYKVILITIEMRQAPFFGWIHDLSVTDPTNVFNLFGLIPFDPSAISPFLHLGIWPLIMGATMFVQQKLNPPPPDPAQAQMLQFMPLIFMFSMGRFPAGLVIYWSWNNTLTIAQQWYIQRRQKLTKVRAIKA